MATLSPGHQHIFSLQQVLNAGSILAGTADSSKPKSASTLEQILRERLIRYDEAMKNRLGGRTNMALEDKDLVELELMTASECLSIVECAQGNIASLPSDSTAGGAPTAQLLGARDLAQIRIHISLAIKWGTEVLLSRILPTLPNKRSPKVPPGAVYVDLSSVSLDYGSLCSMLFTFCRIMSAERDCSLNTLSQTPIVTTLITRHLTDLLRPLICIGWLPTHLRGELMDCGPFLQPFTQRLLAMYVTCFFRPNNSSERLSVCPQRKPLLPLVK